MWTYHVLKVTWLVIGRSESWTLLSWYLHPGTCTILLSITSKQWNGRSRAVGTPHTPHEVIRGTELIRGAEIQIQICLTLKHCLYSQGSSVSFFACWLISCLSSAKLLYYSGCLPVNKHYYSWNYSALRFPQDNAQHTLLLTQPECCTRLLYRYDFFEAFWSQLYF